MIIPLISNGKKPEEPYNIRLGFWLPPDSPYGNFQLKHLKLVQRLDEANRRFQESEHHWRLAQTKDRLPINALEQHVYATEQAVYMLRRAIDELIAMIWCLSFWEDTGRYPLRVEIDCIGAVLAKPKDKRVAIFAKFIPMLTLMNEIANAFKHSFVHSDFTGIGRDEPCINALDLKHNELASGVRFHTIATRQLILDFNLFYTESIQWLKGFSERHRQQGGEGTAPR